VRLGLIMKAWTRSLDLRCQMTCWTYMSTYLRARRGICFAYYINRMTASPRLLTPCRSSYHRCFTRCSEDTIVLDLAMVKMGVFPPCRQHIVSVGRDIVASSRYWSCTSPRIQSSVIGELSCAFNVLITLSCSQSLLLPLTSTSLY
jgi:hypothetical protein